MESFTQVINMSNSTTIKFNDKIKQLGIKIPMLARLLNLPKENLYKWKKGHRPANYEDNIKLENFTKGLFDQFILKGNINEGYDYNKAIAIIFPRNPTNDTYENYTKKAEYKQSSYVQEPSVPFGNDSNALNKIILMQDEQIIKLKFELAECLQQNSKANNIQKTA